MVTFCYEHRIELRIFWALVDGMGRFGLTKLAVV